MALTFAGKKFRLGSRSFIVLGLLLISFVPAPTNGQAPSPSTGIEGLISVSPSHGGPIREGMVDSTPLANVTFEITSDAGAGAVFTTDSAGKFRVSLSPGRYKIKMREANKFPRCGPFEAEVTAAGFNKVEWVCDSGMR